MTIQNNLNQRDFYRLEYSSTYLDVRFQMSCTFGCWQLISENRGKHFLGILCLDGGVQNIIFMTMNRRLWLLLRTIEISWWNQDSTPYELKLPFSLQIWLFQTLIRMFQKQLLRLYLQNVQLKSAHFSFIFQFHFNQISFFFRYCFSTVFNFSTSLLRKKQDSLSHKNCILHRMIGFQTFLLPLSSCCPVFEPFITGSYIQLPSINVRVPAILDRTHLLK